MKNIQFNSIEEADLFVDAHANSIGGVMEKLKAIDKLMHGAIIHGIRDCLDPNSYNYVQSPFSQQFIDEMQSLGVEAFIGKMMSAQRHCWGKRRKLQDFASKHIQCATTEIRTINQGEAIARYEPLTYFDRTVYAVNSLAYKQLASQKPLLIDWFMKVRESNPSFNLTTPYKQGEYYEMMDIGVGDAIKILDNDYIVPHISAKTIYLIPYDRMQSTDGEIIQTWKYGNVNEDWDSFSTSINISFSSIQAEISDEPHLYGDTVYLWTGKEPCIN